MQLPSLTLVLLAAAQAVTAHPHGEKAAALAAQPLHRRGLSHCDAKLNDPAVMRRHVERRAAEVERLRRARGLFQAQAGGENGKDAERVVRRDYRTVLDTDHRVDKGFTPQTSAKDVFADYGACMLSPEVTEGPLYVKGEEIRRDVTEGEGGVKMTLDIQVVDSKTCEPVPKAAIDLWSCNSTGVYGGVLFYPGNGDAADESIINVTTLRGVQFTDDDGVAVFDTVVPGHYSGRANHIHAMVHLDYKIEENKTVTGGRVAHVGQMYFDQSLLQEVEKLGPYSSNKQQWMQNAADFLFIQGATGDDPVVRYTLLGDDLSDGIFGWIRFGVDASADRKYTPAAYLDETGGHQNPSGPVQPGGFGGGMPGGGMPGGGMPGGFPGFPGAPGMPAGGMPGMPGMPMPTGGKAVASRPRAVEAEE